LVKITHLFVNNCVLKDRVDFSMIFFRSYIFVHPGIKMICGVTIMLWALL